MDIEYFELIESELSNLLDNNQFEGALPLLDVLIDMMVKEKATNLDHFYLARGYCLWQLDRNSEAISTYEEAIKLNPTNSVLHNNLGIIYLDDLSDPHTALPLFKRAVELDPDYRLAYFNLGRCYEMLESTIEAAKTYTHALSLDKIDSTLYTEEEIGDEIKYRIHNLFKV